jgi:hypothetical protein
MSRSGTGLAALLLLGALGCGGALQEETEGLPAPLPPVTPSLPAVGDTSRDEPADAGVEPTAEEGGAPDAGVRDGGAVDAGAADAGALDGGAAQRPEGAACGPWNDCIKMEWRSGNCEELTRKWAYSDCEMPDGGPGVCGHDRCVQNAVRPTWSVSNQAYDWTVLWGRGAGATDVLVDWSTPAYDRGAGVHGLLARVDAASGETTPLYGAWGFRPLLIAHRRHALGRAVTDAGQERLAVLRLDQPGAQPRMVEGDLLLAQALAGSGLPGARTTDAAWVQGSAGRLWAVLQAGFQQVWVGAFDLEQGTFVSSHAVPGSKRGQPIADEDGQLYLPLTSEAGTQLLLALTPEGHPRWSREVTALPVAVFGGTLFLDDGAVLGTDTGLERYRWPSSAEAQLRLSDAHAVVARGCGTHCIHTTYLERSTGRVLSDVQLTPEVVRGWSAVRDVMLSEDGRLLVPQVRSYVEVSWFRSLFLGLRWIEVRPDGSWQVLGEYYSGGDLSLPQMLLVDGQAVVRQQDTWANAYAPPPSWLLGFSWPGFRPPAHGWLTKQGGAGSFGPE